MSEQPTSAADIEAAARAAEDADFAAGFNDDDDDAFPDDTTTAAAPEPDDDVQTIDEAEEADEAAFAAGFDDADTGDEQPPAPDTTATETPAPVAAQDSPSLQELRAEIRRLQGRLGNVEARSREQKAVGSALPSGPGPTPADIRTALASKDGIKAFLAEWPEAADMISEAVSVGLAMGARTQTPAPATQQAPVQTREEIEAEIREQIRVETELTTLRTRHADADTLIVAPAMTAWVEKQPEAIRIKWASDSGADVADVLDAYKRRGQNAPAGSQPRTSTANPARSNTARLARGLSPTTGRTVPTNRVPTADEEFNAGFRQG